MRRADRQRALALLTSCSDACLEALMIARDFSIEQMVEFVRDGLATASDRAAKETLKSRCRGHETGVPKTRSEPRWMRRAGASDG